MKIQDSRPNNDNNTQLRTKFNTNLQETVNSKSLVQENGYSVPTRISSTCKLHLANRHIPKLV